MRDEIKALRGARVVSAATPRFGLCCTFLAEPIRFRTTTATFVSTLPPRERIRHLRRIALHNAATLVEAVEWCAAHGIGAYRVKSQLLPLITHPVFGYRLPALDIGGQVERTLRKARMLAARRRLRLSFHPDQFVVLGSVNEAVVQSSLAELEAQAFVAELIGAEQLTIHGGGAQDGKRAALERLTRGIDRLSGRARARLALENDDRIYTVRDLLPVCERQGVPLVYDVHHHRCNPDGFGEREATDAAEATWGKREAWVHLSSPSGGWKAKNPRHHADYIDARDVPASWRRRRITIDVEAKAKELAVLALKARWSVRKVAASRRVTRSRAAGAPRSA